MLCALDTHYKLLSNDNNNVSFYITNDVYWATVLNKGQVLTDYYRLMNRHGGYVWIQTCATIICNAKNVEEQNIIAINYVLRLVLNTYLLLGPCLYLKHISELLRLLIKRCTLVCLCVHLQRETDLGV